VAGYRKAVKALKGPLIVGGFFATLLTVGGALLASGAKNPGLTTAVSILGGLGMTSAGLCARAKAQLTSLLSTPRLELDKQKVREAADLCPKQSEAHAPRLGALWGWLRRLHL
jgi:sulfite exporter TauE/SafE